VLSHVPKCEADFDFAQCRLWGTQFEWINSHPGPGPPAALQKTYTSIVPGEGASDNKDDEKQMQVLRLPIRFAQGRSG
jgi:hypothetical protein